MKKKFFYAVACILSLAIVGCQYDDAEVWDAINNQEKRITDLEEWQKTTNDNIAALQAIVNGSNDYITSVEELKEGDEVVGYTIHFYRQGEVTIYNGKKGDKGETGEAPVIGVTPGDDGRWYWTVNGELMKDANDNPVCASGKDGEDGISPTVATPMVKLGMELGDEYQPYASYLSVDDGQTWTQLTVPMGWQEYCLQSINDYGDHYSFQFYSSENGYYTYINIPRYGVKLQFYLYMLNNIYNGFSISNGKCNVPEGEPFKIEVYSSDGEWSYEVEDGAGWNFSREGDYLVCSSSSEGSAKLKFTHYSLDNEVTYFQIVLSTYVMNTIYRSDNPALVDALVNWYGNGILDENGNIDVIPNLANTQYLYLDNVNLTSLKGLEGFVGLETLHCSNNQLTELDLSALTNLMELNCSNNQLTELDLSALTNLKLLYCSNNQLTKLDISNNLALEYLSCMSSQLKTLDVTNNKNLTYLEVDNNQLESIDISQNTALQTLWIPSNKLTSLDLSSNPNLNNLYCQSNCLSTLDVSNIINLYNLNCGNQRDASGNNQTLILTLSNSQRENWENVWQYYEMNNNVSLAE